MATTFRGRVRSALAHAWNAFTNNDANRTSGFQQSVSYSYYRPDRARFASTTERSIITSIYVRLAVDIASIPIRHVRLDEDGRYSEDIDSGLNSCLTLEANVDQAAQAFRQDIAMTLFDRGVSAIVPVDTTIDPSVSSSFDVKTMRVGEVCAWEPQHVRARVYNEARGYREEIRLNKSFVAIIENPLYAIMNEPNSTLQRLIRKLNMLDAIDEQSASGKLDIIIQLPYTIKSEARKQQANQRRIELEDQLKGSKYGIAYSDATEKIVQLNRPAENNLFEQVKYLTEMVYAQLGLTPEVMNGTADEKTMLNYNHRTIQPIVTAIVEAMRRTFLTKTGRSQGQDVMAFPNLFKFVPLSDIAEIADKFARNEVLSSNEIRQIIGIKPSKDPKADKLINSNMPAPTLSSTPPAALPNANSIPPPLRVPATIGKHAVKQLTAAPSGPAKQQ